MDDACVTREIDQQNRTIRFLAQSQRLASDNMIITAGAGKRLAKDFMRNPIVVPYHWLDMMDGRPCVLGNVITDEFAEDGRCQTVRFATSDLAEEWWHLYGVDKVMRMVSIGWYRRGMVCEFDSEKMLKILEKVGINLRPEEINRLEGVITEYSQRDLSLVPIGADPDAMQHSADGGNGVAQAFMRGYERTDGVWIPTPPPAAVAVPAQPDAVVAALREMTEAFNAALKRVSQQPSENEPGSDGEPAGDDANAQTPPAPIRSGYEELLSFRDIGKPPAPGYGDLTAAASKVAAKLPTTKKEKV
jgi:hypothetical protein